LAGSCVASQSQTELVAFAFWLVRDGGGGSVVRLPALRAAIAAHLEALGWSGAEPLRWAITAVDPSRGLQLEGVALAGALPASFHS
jgi:hypothetical protein